MTRPQPDEAAPYYFKYIDRVEGDVLAVLERQIEQVAALGTRVDGPQSLRSYEPGKWSLRQVLGHVNDTERLFVFRAMWFARGFTSPLPSFEQDVAITGGGHDAVAWSAHLDEFRALRGSTVAFFRNLPADAWSRRGVASDVEVSVRALAYIGAGHVAHHLAIIEERYLPAAGTV